MTTSRVMVTGGAGFVGSRVVDALRARGVKEIFVPRSREYDLRRREDIQRALKDASPQLIVHLAARVGGIGANLAHPAEFFYDNLMMGAQLMDEAWRAGVEKFVAVSTICAGSAAPVTQPSRIAASGALASSSYVVPRASRSVNR